MAVAKHRPVLIVIAGPNGSRTQTQAGSHDTVRHTIAHPRTDGVGDEPERYAALIRALNDNIDYTRRHAMHHNNPPHGTKPGGG